MDSVNPEEDDISSLKKGFSEEKTGWFVALFGINRESLKKRIVASQLELTVDEVVSWKMIGVIGGAAVFVVFLLFGTVGSAAFISLMVSFVGWTAMDVKIDRAKLIKDVQINKEIDMYLDLLSSLTENMTVPVAVDKLTVKYQSIISREFRKATIISKYESIAWTDAIVRVANENDNELFKDVVSQLKLAIEKGTTGTSESLRKIAANIRLTKKQIIEEQIRKISTKMLLPIAFFELIPMLGIIALPIAFSFKF